MSREEEVWLVMDGKAQVSEEYDRGVSLEREVGIKRGG